MAAPNYRVVTLDLATVRNSERIVDQGVGYDAVTVLSLPAGAVVSFQFGENRDPWPVQFTGTFEVAAVDARGCPGPANEGFFVTNPAGGGNLILGISFGHVGVP